MAGAPGTGANHNTGLRALASSYRTRLFMATILVVAVALGLVLASLPRLLEGFFLDQERANLQTRAESVATLISDELATNISSGGARPIVLPTGEVGGSTAWSLGDASSGKVAELTGEIARAGAHTLVESLAGIDDATPGTAEREGRPHDGGQADALEGPFRGRPALDLCDALDDDRRCVWLADGVEQVTEALAILGHLDGLDGRAQQACAGPLEHAGARHLHGQVEASLAPKAGQDAIGSLELQDALDRGHRQRLEVDRVCHPGVGHDGGGVVVEQDGPDAFLSQRSAGLRPGVVELGCLADDHRARADDEDGPRPLAHGSVAGPWARTWPRNRSKTSAASSGPGDPSGWYCTVSMGS